jgi:hypothetical protein
MNTGITDKILQEVIQYKDHGHFVFTPNDSLGKCCNAPTNKNGVYIVFALSQGRSEIIYIGLSGEMQNDGTLKTRGGNYGGMKERIVNGDHYNRVQRKKAWLEEMENENFESLEVYWWVTFDDEINHIPAYVEALLIQRYYDDFKKLPRWNNEF